jgi:hypothetical protein
MIVRIAPGAAGHDRFHPAHRTFVRDPRSSFANPLSDGSKGTLAPASTRGQLPTRPRKFP